LSGAGEEAAGRARAGGTGRLQIFEGESMADQVIKCSECGGEFVFSDGEQQFYANQGFQNPPKRCKPCRIKRKHDHEAKNQLDSGQHARRR
jgi:hypothetical protein